MVTLSTETDNKLLEELKTGFKRTVKWNEYTSEMTKQTKTNNLNYLIDLTFTKVNRLSSYDIKMKIIEFLIRSIKHQVLK